jgi:hypothetical protein
MYATHLCNNVEIIGLMWKTSFFVCIIVLSAIVMEPYMPHIYVCIIVLSGIVLVLTLLHYYLYYSYYAYHSHSSLYASLC